MKPETRTLNEHSRGTINLRLLEIGVRAQASAFASSSRAAQAPEVAPERDELLKLEGEEAASWDALVEVEVQPIRDVAACQAAGAKYLAAQHASAAQSFVLEDAINSNAPTIIANGEAADATATARAVAQAEALRDSWTK